MNAPTILLTAEEADLVAQRATVRAELATLRGHASRDLESALRIEPLESLELRLSGQLVDRDQREQRTADARDRAEAGEYRTNAAQEFAADVSKLLEGSVARTEAAHRIFDEALTESRSESRSLMERAAMLARAGIIVTPPPGESELMRRLADGRREALRAIGKGARTILLVVSE